jgi:hypothetical protein
MTTPEMGEIWTRNRYDYNGAGREAIEPGETVTISSVKLINGGRTTFVVFVRNRNGSRQYGHHLERFLSRYDSDMVHGVDGDGI